MVDEAYLADLAAREVGVPWIVDYFLAGLV